MKTIAATVINDVITPTEAMPNDAKLIVCLLYTSPSPRDS